MSSRFSKVNELTPANKFLLQKLTVSQPVKKFPQPHVTVDWLALLLRIREAHSQLSFRQTADYDYVLKLRVTFSFTVSNILTYHSFNINFRITFTSMPTSPKCSCPIRLYDLYSLGYIHPNCSASYCTDRLNRLIKLTYRYKYWMIIHLMVCFEQHRVNVMCVCVNQLRQDLSKPEGNRRMGIPRLRWLVEVQKDLREA